MNLVSARALSFRSHVTLALGLAALFAGCAEPPPLPSAFQEVYRCGDGVCADGVESCRTCPSDCLRSRSQFTCADGDVYWADNCGNLGAFFEDCGPCGCLGGVCRSTCCGDGVCADGAGESCDTCPADCRQPEPDPACQGDVVVRRDTCGATAAVLERCGACGCADGACVERCCGDGVCEAGEAEDTCSCPRDCGAPAAELRCVVTEDAPDGAVLAFDPCATDAPPVALERCGGCGCDPDRGDACLREGCCDGTCDADAGEDCVSCPEDCDVEGVPCCGDGVCDEDDPCGCREDCGDVIAPRAGQACENGSVVWLDACGERTGRAEDCGACPCVDGACVVTPDCDGVCRAADGEDCSNAPECACPGHSVCRDGACECAWRGGGHTLAVVNLRSRSLDVSPGSCPASGDCPTLYETLAPGEWFARNPAPDRFAVSPSGTSCADECRSFAVGRCDGTASCCLFLFSLVSDDSDDRCAATQQIVRSLAQPWLEDALREQGLGLEMFWREECD